MITLWLALLAATPEPPPPDASAPLFRDVAAQAGVTHEIVCGSMESKRFILEENGSGAALFDYDGDGDLDLYLVNGSTLEILAGEAPPVRNALYRNDLQADDSWRFVDATEQAGVGDPSWGAGAAVGDVDGDGDLDLYVTNFGENVLYENRGDGTFRDVSETSGTDDPGWGHSAAFFDADGDGDLDLYVTNNLEFDPQRLPNGGRPCPYRGLETACGPVGFPPQPDRLFRNDSGDGEIRFTDVSAASGVHGPTPRFGLGVVAGDVDDDGKIDLVIANDSGPNFLFHNQGGGRFEEIGLLAGVATQAQGRMQAGMGIDLGDVDGDGDLDLFVTNFSFDHDTFSRNQGELYFTDESYPSGLGTPGYAPMSWGTRFFDADLDGDLDLYVANGHIYPEVDAKGDETFAQSDQLFLGDGNGRFVEAQDSIVGADGVGRGVAAGDVDLDGDVDLVVVELGKAPALLRNEKIRNEKNRRPMRLERDDSRDVQWMHVAPKFGEGASIAARSDGKATVQDVTRSGSYASSSDDAACFGWGGGVLEAIEIRRGGRTLRIVGAQNDRRYVIDLSTLR